MKKYRILPIAFVALIGTFVMVFSSCEMETSKNGDLDGYWHLESIDTLENGKTCDFSSRKVFWGIEHKLILIKDLEVGPFDGFYMRFNQTGDSLLILKAYRKNQNYHEGDDDAPISADDMEDLRKYGINNLPEGFAKEALSGSKMILRSKTLRLKFKKF